MIITRRCSMLTRLKYDKYFPQLPLKLYSINYNYNRLFATRAKAKLAINDTVHDSDNANATSIKKAEDNNAIVDTNTNDNKDNKAKRKRSPKKKPTKESKDVEDNKSSNANHESANTPNNNAESTIKFAVKQDTSSLMKNYISQSNLQDSTIIDPSITILTFEEYKAKYLPNYQQFKIEYKDNAFFKQVSDNEITARKFYDGVLDNLYSNYKQAMLGSKLKVDEAALTHWISKITKIRTEKRPVIDTFSGKIAFEYRAIFNKSDISIVRSYPMIHWCFLHTISYTKHLAKDGYTFLYSPPYETNFTKRMYSGGEIQYHTSTLKFTDRALYSKHISLHNIELKHGRSGPLCFVTVKKQIKELSTKRLVLTEYEKFVYRHTSSELVNNNSNNNNIPDTTRYDFESEPIELSEILLFRYSKITNNAHLIHYSHEYAKIEGYKGPLVHGPLQASLLADLSTNNIDSTYTMINFKFTAKKPLLVNTKVRIVGRIKPNQLNNTDDGSKSEIITHELFIIDSLNGDKYMEAIAIYDKQELLHRQYSRQKTTNINPKKQQKPQSLVKPSTTENTQSKQTQASTVSTSIDSNSSNSTINESNAQPAS